MLGPVFEQLRDEALAGRLLLAPLSSFPAPPWSLEVLAAVRTPHAEAALFTGAPGDVQNDGQTLRIVGTAQVQHPGGASGRIEVQAVAIFSRSRRTAALWHVLKVDPPLATSPETPLLSVPVFLWCCYPAGE